MLKFIFLLTYLVSVFSKEYEAVSELNINQYIGKWYQVYGDNFNKLFQGYGKCSTADYTLLSNGSLSVLNQQLDKNNKKDIIRGLAYYTGDNCCGYLTVDLNGVPPAPYWVLELGPIYDDLYDYAIVSDDKAFSLYVLTRDVERFYKFYDSDVLTSLNEFGFTKKINSPQVMNQTDCIYF